MRHCSTLCVLNRETQVEGFYTIGRMSVARKQKVPISSYRVRRCTQAARRNMLVGLTKSLLYRVIYTLFTMGSNKKGNTLTRHTSSKSRIHARYSDKRRSINCTFHLPRVQKLWRNRFILTCVLASLLSDPRGRYASSTFLASYSNLPSLVLRHLRKTNDRVTWVR